MKLISVVTPCCNEVENVEETYRQVRAIFEPLGACRYEHIFIDNASTDGTGAILRRLAAQDRNVKVIFNSRNFGHIRSPYYGMLQARGDALIFVLADRQDPLELIPRFVELWEQGHKLVMAVKVRSEEHHAMFSLRKAYYRLVKKVSNIELVDNYYGYGIIDRAIVECLRQMDDPYPYGRGMLAECGFAPIKIEYRQRRREKGVSKNNWYSLYDDAMLGFTSHSKVPLRLATMLGFFASAVSLGVGFFYFVAKLMFWQRFEAGQAPLMIGLFLFASVQLFFIGVLGEYIGAIHTLCQRRPLVFESERLNFEYGVEHAHGGANGQAPASPAKSDAVASTHTSA